MISEKIAPSPPACAGQALHFVPLHGLSYNRTPMHIKTFVGVYPNLARVRPSIGSFLDQVKEAYPSLRAAGYFMSVPEPDCFIYQIEGAKRSYTGVIACLDVLDFLEGRILQHERTLEAEEEKQMRLLLERRAAVKPVLMAYPNAGPLDQWISAFMQNQAPFMEINLEKEKSRHRVWRVAEAADLTALAALFDEHVPRVYIADGHHRTVCSALLYKRLQTENKENIVYDRFLCGLFPESELEILAFNRIVQLPDHLDVETLLSRLGLWCTVKPLRKKRQPLKKHEMTLFVGDACYSLGWKKEVLRAYAGAPAILDTALLNDKILGDLLGIHDVRTDRRVTYTESPKGWRAIAQKTHEETGCIGFCLFPVSAGEFFAVADAGEVLPPKSTWFEPRMKNGLLVQEF